MSVQVSGAAGVVGLADADLTHIAEATVAAGLAARVAVAVDARASNTIEVEPTLRVGGARIVRTRPLLADLADGTGSRALTVEVTAALFAGLPGGTGHRVGAELWGGPTGGRLPLGLALATGGANLVWTTFLVRLALGLAAATVTELIRLAAGVVLAGDRGEVWLDLVEPPGRAVASRADLVGQTVVVLQALLRAPDGGALSGPTLCIRGALLIGNRPAVVLQVALETTAVVAVAIACVVVLRCASHHHQGQGESKCQ